MKLGIVSHTEHCKVGGQWEGLAPTVREIDFVSRHFTKVIHAGCGYETEMQSLQTTSYQSDNVEFVPLIPTGGDRLAEKVKILLHAPRNLWRVLKVIRESDILQLRLPTGMGVYLLPFFLVFVRKPYWVKYAGNWQQSDPPWSYSFQRRLLTNHNDGPITINGTWKEQKSHVLSFENPCMSQLELGEARRSAKQRNRRGPFRFLFVGRLEEAKGVGRILDAIRVFRMCDAVESIHFVGDGQCRENYEREAMSLGVHCQFHGVLPRKALNQLYAKSHFLLLPSDSEGFPKVLAEAGAFGVIPIVSAVSAIPQYITSDHGHLWPTETEFSEWLNDQELFDTERMAKMSANMSKLAEIFTYEHYCQMLAERVFPRLGLSSMSISTAS